ncbi:2-C-methyl-D-erythritol 2,4-cyclodiphosphate synthase, partial [Pelagibacteraceae bacterium]|nr:2-C-methyl-D-erythritol 2,4-cyclodiphosphate synthase [Pelagibacteraceae bacterium]
HALIDSMLGACKMGDIGEKFSDKNNKYKNVKSTKLFKEVFNEVKAIGYEINNIDINIITEAPRLKKFKKKIIKKLAYLCQISPEHINIKAKTTEKLGVIGEEKAIATEVIMSVLKYD